jgi:signal transduction histidine kinase
MHRILERQIIRSLGAVPTEDTPAGLLALLEAVSDTYTHADEDRQLLTRSLELSSKEFVDINKKLRSENEIIEQQVRDRTQELTKANEELQELDKRKSEFLSIAAHQLRTPLSGLKWALNMLIEGDAGPLSDQQKVLLMKSYEGNERLIGLVNEMLQANRIERGVLPLQKVSTQLVDLIDNVLYEVLPIAAKTAVSIHFDHSAAAPPPLVVDPEKMRAVFQNLIENAVKYTRPGGEVHIRVSAAGNTVQFAISDNGIGIPAEEQAHIFSRFFRATNAKRVDPNGTGLGLYIAKNIIEMHGGRIWLESSEGKGTTFYFTLTA